MNSVGPIERNAAACFAPATQLTDYLEIKPGRDANELLAGIAPKLLWLVKDHSLPSKPGIATTAKDYLEQVLSDAV
jgi:hypothetical protein